MNRELVKNLQVCRTYQEIIESTSRLTPTQKADVWKLLTLEQKQRIKDIKAIFDQFPVGCAVALADPYTVAYTYHGTVERVAGTQVVVRWRERAGAANECECYEYTELRRLDIEKQIPNPNPHRKGVPDQQLGEYQRGDRPNCHRVESYAQKGTRSRKIP